MVLLVAEQGTSDPVTGFGGGAGMARRALSDARSVGYPDSLPIFFRADGYNGTIHSRGLDADLDPAC